MLNPFSFINFVKIQKKLKKTKKITLSTIAKELGVSETLVSMVLNGKAKQFHISEQTEKKVLEKADELSFTPNSFARGLRLGKSFTIGLILADISNPFYSKLAKTIEYCLSKNGYSLLFSSSDEDPLKEEKLLKLLIGKQVDGLIVSSTLKNNGFLNGLIKKGFPIVFVDRKLYDNQANQVIIDNTKASADITQYLIDLGHQKIAHLSISPEHISTIKERIIGYKQGLESNNISYSKHLHRIIDFSSITNSVYRALDELLNNKIKASAIYVSNNHLALACLAYSKLKKIKIPDDFSLVCFDDLDVFEYTNPTITSIAQPIEEIGIQTSKLLINKINNPDVLPQTITLPTTIQIRQSCKQIHGKK